MQFLDYNDEEDISTTGTWWSLPPPVANGREVIMVDHHRRRLLILAACAVVGIGIGLIVQSPVINAIGFIHRVFFDFLNTALRWKCQRSANKEFAVPFMALRACDWTELNKSLAQYSQEGHNALLLLSRQLQSALDAENGPALASMNDDDGHSSSWRLSHDIQSRIDRLAMLLEDESRVLRNEIVRPFHVQQCLPSQSKLKTEIDQPELGTPGPPDDATTWQLLPVSTRYRHATRAPPFATSFATIMSQHAPSYSSAGQVLAHVVRDWSAAGAPVRAALYPWCEAMLRRHGRRGGGGGGSSSSRRVLVPGAGLGRLAWELARTQHNNVAVEAVEISLPMAAAAASILQHPGRRPTTLHPYVLDVFANEIDQQRRYDTVTVPNIDLTSTVPRGGRLSYTIGTFEEVADIAVQQDVRYDAIVTCFFIDTADNILHLVARMWQLLWHGGVWINVGPLHWHPNAQMTPSADQLINVLRSKGFEVLVWSFDSEPIEYRSHAPSRRSTYYEGYVPLRFVLRKP